MVDATPLGMSSETRITSDAEGVWFAKRTTPPRGLLEASFYEWSRNRHLTSTPPLRSLSITPTVIEIVIPYLEPRNGTETVDDVLALALRTPVGDFHREVRRFSPRRRRGFRTLETHGDFVSDAITKANNLVCPGEVESRVAKTVERFAHAVACSKLALHVPIHGDFSPANVIVRTGRHAKVIDFDAMRMGDPLEDWLYMFIMLVSRPTRTDIRLALLEIGQSVAIRRPRDAYVDMLVMKAALNAINFAADGLGWDYADWYLTRCLEVLG
jgi:hypothetical protein